MKPAVSVFLADHGNRPIKLTRQFKDGNNFKVRYPEGGGTLGISGWGCAAGTLEPLTYTRASSAEFCYPILE